MPEDTIGAVALRSLTSTQIKFLKSLPKAELHAHLNGSIPLSTLQDLARERFAYLLPNASAVLSNGSDEAKSPTHTEKEAAAIRAGIEKLQNGVVLAEISDFFGLFPAIYSLTSTPDALARATRDVLRAFLEPHSAEDKAQCAYLELRTTPRRSAYMSRLQYLEAVLAEVESYPEEKAALIVSLDRRMSVEDAQECVGLAVQLKQEGRRVVGVDLCGDPLVGDMAVFKPIFQRAKAAGLGITLHIAETASNTVEDTSTLLSFGPDRLGHATFLDEESRKLVFEKKICIEICLTSNILCKTVDTLDVHHIRHHLQQNDPVVICTDDILPFRNSLLEEYALLLARPPLGLGLSEQEVEKIARMSMQCHFGRR